MTCITTIETKKKLKEAINAGIPVYIDDPSIMNPRSFAASEIKEGQTVTVTNHPKRNYFASITRKNGQLKVT